MVKCERKVMFPTKIYDAISRITSRASPEYDYQTVSIGIRISIGQIRHSYRTLKALTMWILINPTDRRSVLTGFRGRTLLDSFNANPYTQQFVLTTYAAT